MKIKVITLFSGYDSQCLALDRLKEQHPDFDYELLCWSEIDKYAIQAHNLIYPQWADRNLGDVSKIEWEKYPQFVDCDLLTYSWPCQSVSAAGKQKGFVKGSGTTSSLLWECERAIKELRPKYLLMENVKALVSKKFMPHFQEWINLVDDELHYKSQWRILNATSFGIPQNRERVFMVSIREDVMRGYDFPEPFPLTKTLDDVLEEEVDERYYLKNDRIEGLLTSTIEEMRKKNGYKFKAKKKDDIANSLTSRCGGVERPTISFRINSSQDGIAVSPRGIAPTHTAGHGNCPKIYESHTKSDTVLPK